MDTTVCKNTKSMYTIDMSSTKLALDELEKILKIGKVLEKFDNKKIFPEIKFGQALFLYYIYHGSDINKTNETRFSLNIRFKSLFSPSGKLSFFRLFKISKLTKLALDKMKEEAVNEKFYSCVDALIPSPLSEQHLIIKKAEKVDQSQLMRRRI